MLPTISTVRSWFRCARPGPVLTLIWLAALAVGPLRATTVEPPDFATLVNDCDYIVHATVKSVTAEKQASPYGLRIVTHVELNVIETVAGHTPATVTLHLLGGQVGAERLQVVGMPKFAVGEEHILFVSGNGQTICPLNRMQHGQYPILHDTASGRAYVARADHAPLVQTADVQQPLGESHAEAVAPAATKAVGLSPGDFIQQIKAAIQPGSRPQRAP